MNHIIELGQTVNLMGWVFLKAVLIVCLGVVIIWLTIAFVSGIKHALEESQRNESR